MYEGAGAGNPTTCAPYAPPAATHHDEAAVQAKAHAALHAAAAEPAAAAAAQPAGNGVTRVT
jgi:hypothetical protein